MALQDFRAIYLPYCIERQPDGSWLIMNREYSPVGFTIEHYQPGDLPVRSRLKGLSPGVLKKLSHSGTVEGDRVFLYDDGCNPIRGTAHMTAYLKKLAILAKLRVA